MEEILKSQNQIEKYLLKNNIMKYLLKIIKNKLKNLKMINILVKNKKII